MMERRRCHSVLLKGKQKAQGDSEEPEGVWPKKNRVEVALTPGMDA